MSILEEFSPFQIGAVPGHRAEEHLFVVKSVLALAEKQGDALALQVLDLSTYFDSECLVDLLDELYKSNVKEKVYRLLYELNKNSKIKRTMNS